MNCQSFELQVACYSGHRADEEPRRFWFGRRTVEVTEVLDRWLDPEHRYFKVRGNDAVVYILRQDTATDRWELTLFDRGTRGDTQLSST